MPFGNPGNGLFHVSLRGQKPPPGPRELRTIGDHLRRRRFVLGLRQDQVAELLGVSTRTVRNWETGVRSPCDRFLDSIVDFLGYDPYLERSNLAQRLRAHRIAAGMSRRVLARQLGVRAVTISRWERGKARPRGAFVTRVLDCIGDVTELGSSRRVESGSHD